MKKSFVLASFLLMISLLFVSCGKTYTDQETLDLLLAAANNEANLKSYSFNGTGAIDLEMEEAIKADFSFSGNVINDPISIELAFNVSTTVMGNAVTIPMKVYAVPEGDELNMYLFNSGVWLKSSIGSLADFEALKDLSSVELIKEFYETATTVTFAGMKDVEGTDCVVANVTLNEKFFDFVLKTFASMAGEDLALVLEEVPEEELDALASIFEGLSLNVFINPDKAISTGFEMNLGSQVKEMLLSVAESTGLSSEELAVIAEAKIEGSFTSFVNNIDGVSSIVLPEDAAYAIDMAEMTGMSM